MPDNLDKLYCPQCGEPCGELREGYCRPCHDERQAALDLHNTQYDEWQRLSGAERDRRIRNAMYSI